MTDAGGVLAISVTLLDPQFKLATFPVGSTPPAWAQALITNPKAWESAPELASKPEGESDGFWNKDRWYSEPSEVPSPDAEPDAPAESTPEPEEDLLGELPEPPKGGPGSGRDAWAAYATSKGIKFADDASRDDIIDAVEAAE